MAEVGTSAAAILCTAVYLSRPHLCLFFWKCLCIEEHENVLICLNRFSIIEHKKRKKKRKKK